MLMMWVRRSHRESPLEWTNEHKKPGHAQQTAACRCEHWAGAGVCLPVVSSPFQLCVQWHQLGGLQLAMVGMFIPQKLVDAKAIIFLLWEPVVKRLPGNHCYRFRAESKYGWFNVECNIAQLCVTHGLSEYFLNPGYTSTAIFFQLQCVERV